MEIILERCRVHGILFSPYQVLIRSRKPPLRAAISPIWRQSRTCDAEYQGRLVTNANQYTEPLLQGVAYLDQANSDHLFGPK